MSNNSAFDTMIDGLSTYRKYSSPRISTMTTDGQREGGTYPVIEMLSHLKNKNNESEYECMIRIFTICNHLQICRAMKEISFGAE